MSRILSASKELEIRFSEVDSMNIVWHGSYPLYFEDAREAFGKKYGLGYMTSVLVAQILQRRTDRSITEELSTARSVDSAVLCASPDQW